jgi:phosphotransferase system enzyme I (PtsI)
MLETRAEITAVRHKVAANLSEGEARIFDAHLMVLEDTALIDEVMTEMRESRKNIEHCYNEVAQRYMAFFRSMEDDYLKERVTDIQDVSRRLLHNLIGLQNVDLSHVGETSVIVSTDLTPSDTANLEREKLMAFITDAGGKTSHSVIMARSLQIPAVVGLHDATHQIRSGDMILVDGYDGLVVIHPTEERLMQFGKLVSERRKLDALYRTSLELPSESLDGTSLPLLANIESADELDQVDAVQAEGVGLFRTEGIFLRFHGYPSEDQQYKEYEAVAAAARGRPVIFRTLDIGGDKVIDDSDQLVDSSFMGFRAIRFCLETPEIFMVQLRAILRASAHKNVKIMFPMVSGMEELRRAKAMLEKAKSELRAEGQDFDAEIPVGAMIEIPSAALTVDLLAREVDFFSLGTNDLIQYLMAVDRLNDRVAHLYEPAHPAVLRTLKQIFDGARSAGVPVSVCGEIAGDPLFAGLLLGMGADSLSLASGLLPELKFYLRKLHIERAQELVAEVMTYDDPNKIMARLQEFHDRNLGPVAVMAG